MIQTTYVYVTSYHDTQYKALIYSIHSLLKFTTPSHICIFYTKPVNPIHLRILKKFDLRIVKNIFPTDEFYSLSMNRLYICSLDAKRLLYIDNDTEFVRSPEPLFSETFDIAGRFFENGECSHIGAQCILFKNNSQKKIRLCWKKLFERLYKEQKVGNYDEAGLYRSVLQKKLLFYPLPIHAVCGYQIPNASRTSETYVIHHDKSKYSSQKMANAFRAINTMQ